MTRCRLLLTLIVTAVITTGLAYAKTHKITQDELLKQATVTKEQATKIALDKVPNGSVKESELEKEHGKLVWSFDIAAPGTSDITEVQVDAKNGQIVSVEKESAEAERNEKKSEHN